MVFHPCVQTNVIFRNIFLVRAQICTSSHLAYLATILRPMSNFGTTSNCHKLGATFNRKTINESYIGPALKTPERGQVWHPYPGTFRNLGIIRMIIRARQ